MANVVGCSIIIKDDFNNVLIAQRKAKRNEPKLWYIFGKKLKGKESIEKCVHRTVKEELKSILFDVNQLDEFIIDSENNESVQLFSGSLREKITCHADIVSYKWVSKDALDAYDFAPGEKEKILRYFSK